MATAAQRERRRRQRQRRKARNSGSPITSRTGLEGRKNLNARTDPGVWVTESHQFQIHELTNAPATKVWHVELEESDVLKKILNTSGEYRILSIRCDYNPLTATVNDRIGVAPYTDPVNRLDQVGNFQANGRPIRKADTRFSEVWNTATEAQSILDVANPAPLIGGISIYFHKAGQPGSLGVPGVDYFIITVTVRYQYRGKKATIGIIKAH